MDHTEVRELLEDAAIEPGGLERLMAGDTPAASIVAGHLAGCADCTEELERLRRSVGLIRPTIRMVPPPGLKERTMAYVAALGRQRGPTVESAPVATPPPASTVAAATVDDLAGRASGRAGRTSRLGWIAGLAAALIVVVTGTALLVNGSRESSARALSSEVDALSAEVDALGDVTRWTLRVDAQPDVQRIRLASATGTTASGSLIFSPTSTELVMVADDLAAPPTGHEYRCWMEVGGRRTSIGKMFFGGDLAYWVGPVPRLGGITGVARFGVSLVDLGSLDAPGQQVLVSG